MIQSHNTALLRKTRIPLRHVSFLSSRILVELWDNRAELNRNHSSSTLSHTLYLFSHLCNAFGMIVSV